MRNRITLSIFLMLILTAAAFGQVSWLDRPVNDWNGNAVSIPTPPRTLAAISANCREQVRTPDSISDRALTRAGWSLFGAAQVFGPITVIHAMASTDGMCRPAQFNAFVFAGDRFIGTLSPRLMDSRTDGSLVTARLNSNSISAEFARYRSSDALCCPSQTSYVNYAVTTGARSAVRATGVETAAACPRPIDDGISTQDNVVSGTVTYRQRAALPANAVLLVKVVDVSRADASAVTVAEQRIDTNGKQVPISFDLAYDRSKVVERNRYAVQAEIRDGDRLMYITDTSYPVITQGNPRNVDIVLVPVGGGGGFPGGRGNTIRGTVTSRQRIALSPNSEVIVRLVDSASPEAAPVAETRVATAGRQGPYQFELRYEQRDINRQRNYELRAEIRNDGRLTMSTPAGVPITLRGGQGAQNDPVELIVGAAAEDRPVVTGRTISLSKFGTGSLKIGTGAAMLVIRGSVTVNSDGTASVSVSSLGGSAVFTGKLIFFDQSTLRIAVDRAGDADAGGEIEIRYTDRRLNSITGSNLTVDGQEATLRF